MDAYLVHSLTWMAVVTASLGLVPDKSHIGDLVRKNSEEPDFFFNKIGYRVDLKKEPSYFTLEHGSPEVTSNVYRSILFQSLRKLYGVILPSQEQGRWTASNRAEVLKSFIPSFAKGSRSYAVDLATPLPVLFDGADFTRVREDLISFMIGGGANRWNNVQLTTAYSRLATGRMVEPTIEVRRDKVDAPVFGADFAPLDQLKWRQDHLYKPMERSRFEGTSQKVTAEFRGYRALFKTGTLGSAGGETEDETLVFIVGKYIDGSGFVPGQTVTGYIYLRKSKDTNEGGIRFKLANPILRDVVEYLEREKPESVGRSSAK